MTPQGQEQIVVERMDEMPPLEATLICCLRLFYEGEKSRAALRNGLLGHLGAGRGTTLYAQFAELCEMARRFSRRPLMRRQAGCCAAGADECAFATMIASAAAGEREDAMLIAVCLVRPHVSTAIVALAEQVGLGLQPMAEDVVKHDARRLH